MSDIVHDFPINATPAAVFAAISTPRGLDHWWTLRSSGRASLGATYELDFGPEYHWEARVSECREDEVIEWQMTVAMPDWVGTSVRFDLRESVGGATQVRFAHRGWAEESEHYRISSFCWAMYLRILRRYLEYGEIVPYAQRLDV